MNKSYKTIWNEVLRAWVAVSEAARGRGGRRGSTMLLATGLLLGLASSRAQATYTLTGDLGLLQFSAPCTLTVPSSCASETRNPLSPSSGAGTLFFPGSYLLVGFNNSNSNNGPTATGSVTFADTSAGRAEGVYLGYEGNTRGTMTISGPGSTWRPIAPNRASPAVIGHYGAGTLDLLDGGRLDSVGSIIGNNPGAQGVVTLSGVPPPSNITDRSQWRNQGALTVGNAGANGALSVRDGAVVRGDVFINVDPSTSSPGVLRVGMGLNAAGSVIIAGADPNGIGSSALFVGTGDGSSTAIGDGGTGTLRVLDGGNIRFDSQGLTIGAGATGRGSVTVSGVSTSGTSSRLSITNSSNVTLVGSASGQGSLDVLAGGSVILPGVTVGASGGSGTVRVAGVHGTGAASRLAVEGLAIGAGSGSSGTLTLAEGGVLSSAASISLASGAGSKGTLNIGAAPGEAPAAPGILSVPAAGPQLIFNDGQGTLNFNHTSANHEFGAGMASLNAPGSGAVINQLAGVTSLTGDNSAYLGTTHVTGGTLRVNGTLGGATSQVNVRNGATLGGTGIVGGSVVVDDGVLAPGNSPGILSIGGNLALGPSSQLNYELGQANVAGGPLNDLTVVAGNLTLDGTLNVTQSAGGQFGAGIYRLIDYAGTLTDNGLALGSMPAGTENFVQTSVANQVNLVNSKGLTLNWWDGDAGGRNDGVIAGGSGTWTTGATSERWTQADGLLNAPYQNPSFAIFAGAPGTVTVDNSQGQVRVSGMQFATSGYRIEGGSVELTAGTNAIRVGDGTAAGAGTSATIASALTGAGKLDKVDAGTLVLTGVNSYTGSTIISGGTLIGSAASFGSGTITDNAALVIEQAGSAAMTNPIDGTGSLTVRAGGTLSYTGMGTLSGPTTVAAGTLAVNGSLANSPVAVVSGATLAGSGTVGATTVQSGATIAPGNGGIGTLTVNGNYTQVAGSTYQVQVQPGTQNADRIAVVGHADIGSGATLNVARSGNSSFAPDVRYTVLSADAGISGRYALTGDTQSAFVQLKDSYDANHVYLAADQFRAFGSVGATANQIATGQALDRLPAGHALGTAMAWLPSEAAARAALDQLSGEVHASVKTAALEDSRFVREAALERLRSAACAPGASPSMKTDRDDAGISTGGCAAGGSERVLWAQTFGSWGRLRGSANAQGLERDIGGFFVGADSGLGNSGWRVGGLGGYSRASADTDTRGRGKTDSYHLGLYGGTQWGATALRLGAAYAWNKVDTQRNVAFAGFADRPSAKYDSRTAQLFGEVGHRIELGSVALEPFAGLAHVQLRSGSFSERGGVAALQGDGDSISSTFATLGVRASTQVGEKTQLRGMLGWRHAFGDTAPESRHAFAGSFTPFAAAGVPLAKNVAVLEAGADTELAPDLKLGAAYAGQFGSGLRDHGFKVNLRWKF